MSETTLTTISVILGALFAAAAIMCIVYRNMYYAAIEDGETKIAELKKRLMTSRQDYIKLYENLRSKERKIVENNHRVSVISIAKPVKDTPYERWKAFGKDGIKHIRKAGQRYTLTLYDYE